MVLRVESLRLLDAAMTLEGMLHKAIEGRRRYSWPWQRCSSGSGSAATLQDPHSVKVVSHPESPVLSKAGPPVQVPGAQQEASNGVPPGDLQGDHHNKPSMPAAASGAVSTVAGLQNWHQSSATEPSHGVANKNRRNKEEAPSASDEARDKQRPQVLDADAKPGRHKGGKSPGTSGCVSLEMILGKPLFQMR